jgi:hypothetical protein
MGTSADSKQQSSRQLFVRYGAALKGGIKAEAAPHTPNGNPGS